MAAGKAYLIKYKGETGNKQSYVFSGSGTISSNPADAAFKGTYALIQHAEAKGNYMLNAGGNAFNQIGETDANIPAFRAYLKGEPQQPIHYSIVHGDGNATSIQPLQTKATIYVTGKTLMIQSDQTRTFNIYSIDGQKVRSAVAEEGITAVDGLAQGIYIVDNQKVIIK